MIELEVIKRLLPGSYGYFINNMDEIGREITRKMWFERFVDDIREKIPELKNVDDMQVRDVFVKATEWAISNICEKIDDYKSHIPTVAIKPEEMDFDVYMAVYRCKHEETGLFFMFLLKSRQYPRRSPKETVIEEFDVLLSRSRKDVMNAFYEGMDSY